MSAVLKLEEYKRELTFEDISSDLYMHLQDIHTDADNYYVHVFGFSRYDAGELVYKSYLGIDEAYLALQELLEEDKWNLFVPHSTLFTFKRKTENVARINAFFVDIDRNEGYDYLDVEAVIKALDEYFFEKKVPKPSKIIRTGGGIQIFWLLKHAPKQALKKWQRVEERITNELCTITQYVPSAKVDQRCKDVVRNTRPPGTKNYRYGDNGVEVYALRNSSLRYTIDGVIKQYYPELELKKVLTEADKERIQAERDAKMARKKAWEEAQERRKKEQEQKDKVKGLIKQKKAIKPSKTGKTQGTLISARERDLFVLIELRGGDMEGYRYTIITIYAWLKINVRMSEEDVLELCHKMNDKFRVPLTEKEILSIAKSVFKTYNKEELGFEHEKEMRKELEDRGIIDLYKVSAKLRFKNETCIAWLDITEEEQEKMETIISRKEKYARNNSKRYPKDEDGYSKKKIPLKERRAKVKELMDKGYGYKRIATELGISQDTAKNDVRALKK